MSALNASIMGITAVFIAFVIISFMAYWFVIKLKQWMQELESESLVFHVHLNYKSSRN